MRDYTDVAPDPSPEPTPLTSVELIELVATRSDLTALIDYFIARLNWFFDGTMPATYTSRDEISDLVGDLILRRSHLQHHMSDTEQLVAEQ